MIDQTHFPLAQAFLCAELACSAVGNDPQCCPACGNGHLVSLQRIMDRKPVQSDWSGAERRMAWTSKTHAGLSA